MSRRGIIVFNSQAIRKYPGEADELLQTEFFDSAITPPVAAFGQVLVSGVWKVVSAMQVAVSEVWKPVTKAQVMVSGSWKELV
jgi:hypothetical protein